MGALGVFPGTFSYKLHSTVPLLGTGKTEPEFARVADFYALRGAPFSRESGSHADVTAIYILDISSQAAVINGKEIPQDTLIDAPPGVIGSTTAASRCSGSAFTNSAVGNPVEGCPPSSQVGVMTAFFGGAVPDRTFPIYQLAPEPGHVATFGFPYRLTERTSVIVNADLRTDGDYGITLSSTETKLATFFPAIVMTFWGVPADPIHDQERWNPETQKWGYSLDEHPQVPLVSNATGCSSGVLEARLRLRYWRNEADYWLPKDSEDFAYRSFYPEPIACEELVFKPRITLKASTSKPESPTALSAQLSMPANHDVDGPETPPIKQATLALSDGVSINPAAAQKLTGCSPEEIGLQGVEFAMPSPIRFDAGDAQCPESSRIGTGLINTQLIEEPIKGNIYLATPYENPFHTPIALYLVFTGHGFTMKLPVKVEADGETGRLIASLDSLPQLAFEKVRLKLFGGPEAVLATSSNCNEKVATAYLTPWSASGPEAPIVVQNPDGSETEPTGPACDGSSTNSAFAPEMHIGVKHPADSTRLVLSLHLGLPDEGPEVDTFAVTLPPGLTGSIRGVASCSEAGIEQASERDRLGDGVLEATEPSCPADSKVGLLRIGVGVGPRPLFVDGSAYLAGQYKGAPLSLVIVTPALAGGTPMDPIFDLGTAVSRAPLDVDPHTGSVTARFDSLPRALNGIPLDMRDIRLVVDRPGIIRTPSSCESVPVTLEAMSRDGMQRESGSRYQPSDCKSFRFGPRLAARRMLGTAEGEGPKLWLALRGGSSDAGIARARIDLPSSVVGERWRSVACVEGELSGNGCVGHSVVGHAAAWTTQLERPLRGPIYLRASGHDQRRPELVLALGGQLQIRTIGQIEIKKERVQIRLRNLPDVPMSKLVLTLNASKKGWPVRSHGFCRRSNYIGAHFAAYNGKIHNHRTVIAGACSTHRAAVARRPGTR